MVYPKASTDPEATGVPPTPRFPTIEERVLAYWAKDGTFLASVEARDGGTDGSNEFVFYDGPPFANGLPHYGHLLTGYVKDLVPRYRTMRGRRVERRFGWDTHGLPAELEAQRQLGLKTTQEITDLGIATFNDACRNSVLRYTKEWEEYVTRQARWVDFEHDYKTLDTDYMESVIWAFKQLHEKGLAYEGFRILPYCWNDQTPLSNHELRMDDDVYQMRQDPAITVGYRLETGELALIWTTTPWTLPSNMGVAVHPDVDYVVVQGDKDGGSDRYLLAEARLAAYTRELGDDAAERIVALTSGYTVASLHAAVHLLPGVCRRAPDLGGGLRHDRGRHRAGPHEPRLRRGRQTRSRRPRGGDRRAGGPGRLLRLPGDRLRRVARLRCQPPGHRPPQGPHPRAR